MSHRISAIVPAYTRVTSLLRTLERLNSCNPTPDEIIVHVDGANTELMDVIRDKYPEIMVLQSCPQVGPGGARNKLIAAAKYELVANFDDDSYPIDSDYFSKIQEVAIRLPDAAILSAVIVSEQKLDVNPGKETETHEIHVFSGCGCVYRKSWFMKTSGYVPIPIAYSMEETDLSLRYYALGGRIVETAQLQVCHQNPLEANPPPIIRTFSIANIALFGFLRFPVLLWPIIPLQILSRLVWLIRHGFYKGLLQGLKLIPSHVRMYANYRKVLPTSTIVSWLILRRFPGKN